jgi:hypothetical protein
MKCLEHTAHVGDMRNGYIILFGRPQMELPLLGILCSRLVDSTPIKVELKRKRVLARMETIYWIL